MIQKRLGVILLVALAGGVAAAQQAGDLPVKARIDAFFQALASGDAAKYEAMAREHFGPDFLARRTPEERKQMVERVRADFGTLSLGGVQVRNGTATLQIRGTTGLEGRCELTFEAATASRITRVAIMVGGPGGDEGPGGAPPAPVNPTMAPAQMSQALDGYLAPLAASDTFAGVVLVARGGKPVFEKAYGLADRERRAPIAPATRFNLGSINKILTKTAIAQLVAQGTLALTDTIGKLLPDYPNAQAKPATVDQLLNHRAGIADFFGPDFAKTPKTQFRSNADYYRFVAPKPLLFEPGTKSQYCNGCYVVLGAILERVSGQRYEDYVTEHVFKPAGMNGAGFFQSDRFPSDVAIGYTRESPQGPGPLHSNEQMHGASGSAAGGAYATAADLLAFDNGLRERRLVDAKMTAWILGGAEAAAGPRAMGDIGIAGGAPGCNANMESNGAWTIVVVGNLDPPNAVRVGTAIRRALGM
jgi:CubicO group peptidase (beta-lactamase class C family)